MSITASAEDYLEIILLLTEKSVNIRAIDIVNEMGYSRASVSVAMRKLREQGLIEVDGDGSITLTESGNQKARNVYNRHTILCDWLIRLGVNEKTAVADACRMEHILSDSTFEAFKRLYEEG
jgi:Mn-dependent DtxR family transcriptional regulator